MINMKNKLLALMSLAIGILPFALHAQEDELLEPEKAFAMSASVSGPESINVHWKIADGYYMYQNKVRLELEGEGVELQPVKLPAGKKKHDEFFGEVEIYKKEVSVPLIVKRSSREATTVTLKAHSQGCNEPIGVCYPPLTQTATLELPAMTAGPDQPAAEQPESLSSLKNLLDQSTGEQEFLEPDQAFQLSVKLLDAHTARAELTIAEGYYLYRDKTRFQSATPDITLGDYTLPKGEEKMDEFFGKQDVYHQSVAIELPLKRSSGAAGTLELTAHYQGCADAGICYPPIRKTVSLALPAAVAGSTPPVTAEKPAVAESAGAPLSEEERIRGMLSDSGIWLTVGAFFLAGLGLALTPCVFPMIPILSGIIVGQGESVTRQRAFILSVVYVLGMAITYTAAGVAAGMTGELLSSAFQNPWVLGSFALVFVLLSLSMFGFYDLQLPSSWQARLSETSNKMQGGAFTGVFIMGALSALIVGPCVAAPLSGALLYIGQSGDWLLGGTALFAMSLGMGVPLIVVGTSAGSLMPRAGTWMETVKAVFGVLLLAVAVWMISRVIPPEVTLILYALLLIIPAIYMRAVDALPEGASGWSRLWKGLGLVMLIYGIMLLLGGFTGAKDPLDPLSGLRGGGAVSVGGAPVSHAELPFITVKGAEQLNARLAEAASAGKPVMLDFYADWCVECVRMENTTFKDPAVQQALSNYMLLRTDVTLNDEQDKAALKQFKLFGPPALVFFNASGEEMRSYRLVGYFNPQELLAHLEKLAAAG
jgi:thiol:disulfide interchange protein DsbD